MGEAFTDDELVLAELKTALSPDTYDQVVAWKSDLETVSQTLSVVADDCTGGRLSKPTYPAETYIEAIREHLVAEGAKDALEEVEFERGLEESIVDQLMPGTLEAVTLVAKERVRQVQEEGWTPEHDDEHANGEMALAGAMYAASSAIANRVNFITKLEFLWPDKWAMSWWKPTTPLRDLVKAGALIIAEIERRTRAGEEK